MLKSYTALAVSLNSASINGIGASLPPSIAKDQPVNSKVLFVKPNLEFVICTVSPISNWKASKLNVAVKLICCLAFNNCIFASLCTVVDDVVIGKSNSPNILSSYLQFQKLNL